MQEVTEAAVAAATEAEATAEAAAINGSPSIVSRQSLQPVPFDLLLFS